MTDEVRLVHMEHNEAVARRAEEAAADAGASADISLGSAKIALKAAQAMPTPLRPDPRDNIDYREHPPWREEPTRHACAR